MKMYLLLEKNNKNIVIMSFEEYADLLNKVKEK